VRGCEWDTEQPNLNFPLLSSPLLHTNTSTNAHKHRVAASRNSKLSISMGKKRRKKCLKAAERAPQRHWIKAMAEGREALAAVGHPAYAALRQRQQPPWQLEEQEEEQQGQGS